MLTRGKARMTIDSSLQNHLVLSKILSYLPLEDLKATRQVNQLWKDESRKYFKRRALVHFDYVIGQQPPLFDQKLDECLELRNSSQCHENFYIRQLHSTGITLTHPESKVVQSAKMFEEKVKQLVQLHGPSIRSLKLYLSLDGSTNFKFLTNILKSVPQLKELELYIWFHNVEAISKEDWMGDFTSLEPLVHLKTFMLRSNNPAINDKHIPKLRQLLRKLLQLTQNVETLDLQRDDRTKYDAFYLEGMQMEWNEAESKGHKPFKNLSSIRIKPTCMDQLLKLSLTIRKLSIYSFHHDLKEASLQELLKKHAKTLETLQIGYSINRVVEENGLVMNFEFPNLPRLKSLEVNVYEPYEHRHSLPVMRFAVERRMLSFGLLESFMMGGEKFEEKFPLLRSFTLKIRDLDEEHAFNPVIYERILPRPNQDADLCFPQFTSFNISGPLTCEYCSQEEYNEWIIWLAKLFPNVHSPQFNMARLTSNH